MADVLAKLSRLMDAKLAAIVPAETLSLHRVIKVAEESGEVIGALIGWTGTNPRKGVTHTENDLIKELLDVAVAALGAVEHLTGNRGDAEMMMMEQATVVLRRLQEEI